MPDGAMGPASGEIGSPFIDLIAARAEQAGTAEAVREIDGRTLRYCDLLDAIDARASALMGARTPASTAGLAPLDALVEHLAGLRAGVTTLHGSTDTATHRAALHSVPDTGGGSLVMIPTAGTTGTPRCVVHDQRSLFWGLWNTASIQLEASGYPTRAATIADASDALLAQPATGLTFYSGMPLSSISGLSSAHRALALGDRLVLDGDPKVSGATNAVLDAGATSLGLPPIAARQLIRDASTQPLAGKVLSIGLGGASVPGRLAADLEGTLGCLVTIGYGATEFGGVVTATRPWDPPDVRHTTVGRPVGNVEIRTATPETTSGVPQPVLEVRSPATMLGRLDETGFQSHSSTWLASADLIGSAPGEPIVLRGRSDQMILRGGRLIDPCTVENIVNELPLVAASAAVPVASRVQGEHDIVLAYVAAPSSMDRRTRERTLRQACLGELPAHAVPRRIVEVESLPLTHDGTPRRDLVANLVGSLPAT